MSGSYCPKCQRFLIPNAEKCPSCKFNVRSYVQSNYYVPMKKKADLERTLDQDLNFLWKIILFFNPFFLILLYILPFSKKQRKQGRNFVFKVLLFELFVIFLLLVLFFAFFSPYWLLYFS